MGAKMAVTKITTTNLTFMQKVSQMFIELAENLLKRLKLEQLANTN